ncbi:MAG: glycosyltransferase family 39 protein [Candidatus Krumholzibacteriia bacterium]
MRFLLLVTLLAAVLRLWRLDAASLWVDEIMTWRQAAPGGDLVFWRQVADAIHGPVYVAAVWPLLRLADTEFALRLPAALAGIAAVPILAVAAARLLPRESARLAALLFALNPFHVWYSQEARGYAFAMLAVVALAALVVGPLRRGLTSGRGVALAVVAALGIGSHMSVLFVWAALALTVLVAGHHRDRRQLAGWAAVFAGGVLLAAPWLAGALGIWAVHRVVPGADVGDALRGATTFTPLALPFTGYTFLFGFSLGPGLRELHVEPLAAVRAHAPLLAVAALAAAVPLAAGLWRWPRRSWYVLLWILVPLVAAVLLAMRNVKPFNPRYVAVVLPFVLLLVGHGLRSLPRRMALVWTAALVVLVTVSLAQYQFADRYAKEDVRAALDHVASSSAPDDPVLAPVVTGVVRYYHEGAGEVIGTFETPQLGSDETARALVRDKLAGYDSAWVLLARTWYHDPDDRLPWALAAEGRVRLAGRYPGVRVLRWERYAADAADAADAAAGGARR